VAMTRLWERSRTSTSTTTSGPCSPSCAATALKLGLVSNGGREIADFVAHHKLEVDCAIASRGPRVGEAARVDLPLGARPARRRGAGGGDGRRLGRGRHRGRSGGSGCAGLPDRPRGPPPGGAARSLGASGGSRVSNPARRARLRCARRAPGRGPRGSKPNSAAASSIVQTGPAQTSSPVEELEPLGERSRGDRLGEPACDRFLVRVELALRQIRPARELAQSLPELRLERAGLSAIARRRVG
jgi:hypothetical protein